MPCGPKPLVYDSPAHSPASSVFPWHQHPSAEPYPAPLFDGISEGCGGGAPCQFSAAAAGVAIDGYSPSGGARAPIEQATGTAAQLAPFAQLPPFAEGGARQLCGGDMESGAVPSAVATAALPLNVGMAKDTCADAPASRSMIGSERPLSRPTTGGSAAPDLTSGGSVGCAGVATAASGVADAYTAPAAGFGGGGVGGGCPASDGSGTVNVLQLDCNPSRDSIAGGSPCEGCMSPVATPAGLNSIRLPRARAGAPADPAAEREWDTATSADMWAGASPFLSVQSGNTPAAAQEQQAEETTVTAPVVEKAVVSQTVSMPPVSDTRGALRHHLWILGGQLY